MNIGVIVPQGWTGEYKGFGASEAWARTRDVAWQAEALGFESIWLFDHFHTVPRPTLEITFEAFTSLAALAAADELGARLGSTLLVVSTTDGTSPRPEGTWTERVDSWDAGDPAGALVERSREADLVVVGPRGLHGLRAIGSVSERVAHHARCSVLVVHAG